MGRCRDRLSSLERDSHGEKQLWQQQRDELETKLHALKGHKVRAGRTGNIVNIFCTFLLCIFMHNLPIFVTNGVNVCHFSPRNVINIIYLNFVLQFLNFLKQNNTIDVVIY